VKELNAKLFRHSISEDLLHIAICAPSAGYEYDYERLEMLGVFLFLTLRYHSNSTHDSCPLGDAFLKYLSTIYVFVTYPSHSEGSLHTARLRIISNKSLFQNASHVGLPAYIQAKPFAPRQWHPPNFELDQPSRAPGNKATQGSTAGDDVEDSQAMDAVWQSSLDPAPERPLSRTESPTAYVPPQKPKKQSKKQSEDRQWLGNKVTYSSLI
jgi:endoribonuclease Dicer